MLSELYEIQLNLFSIGTSITLPREGHPNGLVPQPVDGAFESIILIEKLLGESVLATALLDRFLYNARGFSLKGQSYRMKHQHKKTP